MRISGIYLINSSFHWLQTVIQLWFIITSHCVILKIHFVFPHPVYKQLRGTEARFNVKSRVEISHRTGPMVAVSEDTCNLYKKHSVQSTEILQMYISLFDEYYCQSPCSSCIRNFTTYTDETKLLFWLKLQVALQDRTDQNSHRIKS